MQVKLGDNFATTALIWLEPGMKMTCHTYHIDHLMALYVYKHFKAQNLTQLLRALHVLVSFDTAAIGWHTLSYCKKMQPQ